MTVVKDAKGNTTSYEYDCEGNKTKMTDANGNANIYQYDDLNRMIAAADPDGDTIYYVYNADGTLQSKTDANGITCNLSYDTFGRLIKKDFPGTDQDIVFEYDLNGNKTKEIGSNFEFTYTYDAVNRLLSKTDNILNKTISYTYDNVGNRATMTDGENGLTEYTYDNLNRLVELENPDNEITAFSYGKIGEKLTQTNANGTLAEYSYDTGYRMILLANVKGNGDTISSFAYSYDNAGNRMSKIYENGDTEMYSYDSLYQLVKVQTKDKTTEYEYDAVGNRLRLFTAEGAENAETTVYNYNTDNQLLYYTINGIDTKSYLYDANGNAVQLSIFNSQLSIADTYYYSFNYENNLTQISAVNDTNVLTYTYSSGINRLSKTTNGQTVKYFYDNNDVLTEYDTNNVVVCRYTTNLRIDDIISAKRGGTVEYFHKDALGSITNLTLSNENILVSYRYTSFGSIESQSNEHQNEFTYTGRQIDREAGLYYYRSRYYNSEIGRFTQKDKIGAKGGLNLYLYVKDNPIIYIDPSGKCKQGKLDTSKKWNENNKIGYSNCKKTGNDCGLFGWADEYECDEYKATKGEWKKWLCEKVKCGCKEPTVEQTIYDWKLNKSNVKVCSYSDPSIDIETEFTVKCEAIKK